MHNQDRLEAIDYRFSTLECDEQLHKDTMRKWDLFHPTAEALLSLYQIGCFTVEGRDGLMGCLPDYVEIIPVHKDFSRNQRRMILRNEFTFTANQCFSSVLYNCALQRDWNDPDLDPWIGRETKKFLKQLHADGLAHSVEVYAGGELLAGLVGIQSGGLFIGLSVYSDYMGAGNAAFIAMLSLLSQAGFRMVDALSPSCISRSFGGEMVAMDDHIYARKEAIVLPVRFPTCSTPRPVAELLQPR